RAHVGALAGRGEQRPVLHVEIAPRRQRRAEGLHGEHQPAAGLPITAEIDRLAALQPVSKIRSLRHGCTQKQGAFPAVPSARTGSGRNSCARAGGGATIARRTARTPCRVPLARRMRPGSRGEGGKPMAKVLLGFDGSAESRRAARKAAELAASRGSTLVVAQVVPPLIIPGAGAAPDLRERPGRGAGGGGPGRQGRHRPRADGERLQPPGARLRQAGADRSLSAGARAPRSNCSPISGATTSGNTRSSSFAWSASWAEGSPWTRNTFRRFPWRRTAAANSTRSP